MPEVTYRHATPDDRISLTDVLRWSRRWWWLVVGAGLAGLMVGLIWYLASDQRFVVRLDITLAQTPLGEAAFIRDISVGVLQEHVGPDMVITSDSRQGTLSLTEQGLPEDAIATRQAAMRNAILALEEFLKNLVSSEYSQMQANFKTMPPSPESYAALTPFRLYIAALEEGLLEPVTIVSERVRPQGVTLPLLLLVGAMAGVALAVAVAFVTDELRNRPIDPPA